MTALQTSPFRLNGAELTVQGDGSVHWPARKTLIVADLHFEKGSAYARTGQLLPPYDTRATLAALRESLTRLRPERVLCLGDSFHDGEAASRLSKPDQTMLADLIGQIDWIWIAGNHDPSPPQGLGGRVVESMTDGPLVFRHEAVPSRSAGELSGHFHPKARIATRARALSARCLIEDGRRAVLPSYGQYTGGLSVWDPALQHLFPKGFNAHMILKPGALCVPASRLIRRE